MMLYLIFLEAFEDVHAPSSYEQGGRGFLLTPVGRSQLRGGVLDWKDSSGRILLD